jgi:hypothetical protein
MDMTICWTVSHPGRRTDAGSSPASRAIDASACASGGRGGGVAGQGPPPDIGTRAIEGCWSMEVSSMIRSRPPPAHA